MSLKLHYMLYINVYVLVIESLSWGKSKGVINSSKLSLHNDKKKEAQHKLLQITQTFDEIIFISVQKNKPKNHHAKK